MAIRTTDAPALVAYFNVFVPYRSADSAEDAQRIVNRYLYTGFMTTTVVQSESDLDEPFDSYKVHVRYADHISTGEGRIQQQRDRLSSGLYASSEPVLFRRDDNA
ncbi:hypothetical protein [Terracoccus sp. 273MFTsu3.1]|uniref:hypothetical protein n=1 Tax=Terracoccus sp. 273MFTsu3.1 TaxID=1172188 RepID=UPI00037C2C18|nr:hypothetical protein [Terracoccus sp. 273MFTsu3.1]